ncbi:hypothetical protein NDU88_003701 [Pleurodeles waltl]|uniref:Reverse transcriptase domain-containing protein n=1 Tax=Pleurodeles waltl TaxID=8319 RepID=A0AAV7UEF6_PLEWA|nr:hypothetical protein NDU88_003701 [Pleurodeles waltl]
MTVVADSLTEFGRLSGLQVNATKSCTSAFLTDLEQEMVEFGGALIPVATHTFRYLEIRIFRHPQDILGGNLLQAVNFLKPRTAFWTTLPLSVACRLALAKMVLLPRLLNYFATLPVVVPAPVFRILNTLLTELAWGTGRRKVSLPKLQLPVLGGCMGAPDLNLHETGLTPAQVENGQLHGLLCPGMSAPRNTPYYFRWP